MKFYTQILGFKISDIYEPDMVPGGMVFMRFGDDHHGVGLVGAMPDKAKNIELHHLAFEVANLDELLRVREHLERSNVTIDFHGRRRAGAQIAVEFTDPDGHQLELFWGLDKVGSDESSGRARNGGRQNRSKRPSTIQSPARTPVSRTRACCADSGSAKEKPP